MPSLLLLLVSLLPVLVSRWWFPGITRVLLADLRLPRIVFYAALATLGHALFLRGEGRLWPWGQSGGMERYALLVVCLTYAAVFAIVTNNLEDLEADRITNRDRPLVQGHIHPRPYLVAGIVAQAIALLLALAGGIAMFWTILAISVGYFGYSCRPFRWKKVPIVAKLLIGLNAFAVVLGGFALAGGEIRAFPVVWGIFILVPVSLSANFVDLKDTEGDRATGIQTLPVLLGETNARHLIACATLATYLMGGVLLGIWWLYPLNALLAGVHVWLLYRQPYREKHVFLVFVPALFGLSFFLFLSASSC